MLTYIPLGGNLKYKDSIEREHHENDFHVKNVSLIPNHRSTPLQRISPWSPTATFKI